MEIHLYTQSKVLGFSIWETLCVTHVMLQNYVISIQRRWFETKYVWAPRRATCYRQRLCPGRERQTWSWDSGWGEVGVGLRSTLVELLSCWWPTRSQARRRWRASWLRSWGRNFSYLCLDIYQKIYIHTGRPKSNCQRNYWPKSGPVEPNFPTSITIEGLILLTLVFVGQKLCNGIISRLV